MSPNEWRPWEIPVLRAGNEKRAAGEDRKAVFHVRTVVRPMRVVIDARLRGFTPEDEYLEYLGVLLAEEGIETLWFSSDGPSQDVDVQRSESNHYLYTATTFADDWVIVSDSGKDHVIAVHCGIRNAWFSTGLWKDHSRFGLADYCDVPKEYAEESDPRQVMYDDILGIQVAEAVKADIFVTDQAFLSSDDIKFSEEVAVVGSREAIPLIGLYLRTSGVYRVSRADWGDVLSTSLPRWFFYWAAAFHALKLNGRRLESESLGETEVFLRSSLQSRVASMLESRDRLLQCMAIPSGNQSSEGAVDALVDLCIWLTSAFDVAALYANCVLGVDAKDKSVAWQRTEWLNKVKLINVELASMFQEKTNGRHLLDLIHEIRNSVHGESLTSSMGADDLSVGIPPSRVEALAEAVEALGGSDLWGANSWSFKIDHMYNYSIHPGKFEKELVPRSLKLLREIIDIVGRARLKSDDLSNDSGDSEGDEEFDRNYPFHGMRPRAGRRILWQLGLS